MVKPKDISELSSGRLVGRVAYVVQVDHGDWTDYCVSSSRNRAEAIFHEMESARLEGTGGKRKIRLIERTDVVLNYSKP